MLLIVFGIWTVRTSTSHAATTTVQMKDFAFQPADVTVSVGDTVTWTNEDSEPHAPQGGPFNAPDVPPGGSFSFTFNEAGDVSYICRIHTYMSGVVHVVNGPVPSTTSTSAAPATTTTTAAPGATTTTTTPGATTTTTAPSGSSGSSFQEVPDDPSGRMPPSGFHASSSPSASPATTSTTAAPQSSTTTSTTTPPDSFQEVPNDPTGGSTPGKV